MKTFLVAILSTIALGTLLIAFALLAPQAFAAPAPISPTTQAGYVVPAPTADATVAPRQMVDARSTPAVVRTTHATVRTREVARGPRRDWTKTLLVVGGSTAAGAGLGGIVGGGKGAAIGAAIGGGASTLFEALRR